MDWIERVEAYLMNSEIAEAKIAASAAIAEELRETRLDRSYTLPSGEVINLEAIARIESLMGSEYGLVVYWLAAGDIEDTPALVQTTYYGDDAYCIAKRLGVWMYDPDTSEWLEPGQALSAHDELGASDIAPLPADDGVPF